MWAVRYTVDAQRDLEDLLIYVAEHDAPGKADHLLDRIDQVLRTLAESPHRGTVPRELSALGRHDYRQVLFKPYRLIYRVLQDEVLIVLVTDGRRDMRSLLQRRLLANPESP